MRRWYAIWNWRETTTPVDQFRYPCHRCRHNETYQRLEVTTTRTLFWIPLPWISETQPVLSCQRCGTESHPRDLSDLASPELRRRYGAAVRACAAQLVGETPDHPTRAAAVELVQNDRATYAARDLDDDVATIGRQALDEALLDLREEASPHVAGVFIRQMASIAAANGRPRVEVIAAVSDFGRHLLLTPDQIEKAVIEPDESP